MRIQALEYDPETDELDLLIDSDAPQPAESIPVDAGVYFRREVSSGRIVGAMIRGYENFLRVLLPGQDIPATQALESGLEKEFLAVLEWQKEALRLSHSLRVHLGTSIRKTPKALVETLLSQTS